jgi:large subunit ribosomal protein L2
MALKVLKPTTAGQRGTILINHKGTVTTSKPEKSLTYESKKQAGRSHGAITVRHKGGAVKKKYRVVDFKRLVRNIVGTVMTIEYDPNRNVYISLINHSNGQKSYILTPQGLQVGSKVMAGDEATPEIGNAMPIRRIPAGSQIHNIEVNPGSGGAMVRAAGLSATIMGFDGDKAQIKLPSKEVRIVNANCYATIGALSNADYKNTVIGKAGRNRRKGIRPTVRGMVMPPNSHPHGGGEAKGVIGHVAKDVWGNVRGKKTRRVKHRFTKNILVNRKGRKIVVK